MRLIFSLLVLCLSHSIFTSSAQAAATARAVGYKVNKYISPDSDSIGYELQEARKKNLEQELKENYTGKADSIMRIIAAEAGLDVISFGSMREHQDKKFVIGGDPDDANFVKLEPGESYCLPLKQHKRSIVWRANLVIRQNGNPVDATFSMNLMVYYYATIANKKHPDTGRAYTDFSDYAKINPYSADITLSSDHSVLASAEQILTDIYTKKSGFDTRRPESYKLLSVAAEESIVRTYYELYR